MRRNSDAFALEKRRQIAEPLGAMKTMTISEARGNLSAVLDRVCRGEDIGIVAGSRIVHLKPVEVVSWEDSYAFREYGVTPEEWARFRERVHARRGKTKDVEFKGAFDPKALG